MAIAQAVVVEKYSKMSVFGKFMRGVMLARCSRIERAVDSAVEVQYSTLESLLERGRNTAFGRRYGLDSVHNAEQFALRVEVFDYDSFEPFVERMRRGESNVTCEGRVTMFARSSGTSARSKYIPVTQRALRMNHLRGMADVVSLYLAGNPASHLFDGRTLTLGGSCRVENGTLVGDLSALLISSVGRWGEIMRAPSRSVALMADFDAKCDAVCRECAKERIVALAGVPSWNMALLRRVLEYTGRRSVKEVWPDLELFMHGGVSFAPYRNAFADVMGGKINYMESYNASEGFVAIAEQCGSDEVLLMPDYGCYYEFAHERDIVPLEGVKIGVEYALLMTSENGLWRYALGDVVVFTSLNPYRIRIVGRTKEYINAFGEEVMIGNVEEALLQACFTTGAVVEEYTISPVFVATRGGYHRWVVEFVYEPDDIKVFAEEVDKALRELNSDYDAKRSSVMQPLAVVRVPYGTFHCWQSRTDRRKVPRLCKDSSISDEVLTYARERVEV